ncbi:MAG TPA: phosphatidylglycerol lysyltransferase domain-containing protein, partial [Pseudonocardiaceae bacterium]|nr:phosphatidylglycerol lysyltransferase domain-containing protein [Pseudonocardiaceae bacterium]
MMETKSPERTLPRGATTVRIVVWSTRLVGLLTLAAVVFPVARRRFPDPLAVWFALPVQATVAGAAVAVAAGVCLVLLATGLRRRKRRAWQIAVLLTVVIAALHVVFRHGELAAGGAICLFVVLVVYRSEFTALPDPAVGRWRAVLVCGQLLLAGAAINLAILVVNHRRELGPLTLLDRVDHALLALVGVSGPVRFRAEIVNDLTATIGLVFGLGAVLLAGYYLLRSAEPAPALAPADEQRMRALLDAHPDSLGYFALRRDKSVVFSPSGKSAVTYRVLVGVALTSGDPLGDVEAWPGAIDEYLATCRRQAWVPAVLGCSATAGTVWARHGLEVLELGDEAVVDAASFSLAGRRMRGVRQAVARVRRAGYEVQVRRSAVLSEVERAELAGLADAWRGTDTERGFSMALSRVAAEDDPGCVLVTAVREGQVRGILQFVPWGCDGLSLDLMRRDVADNGLNEFMISSLLAACPALGVRQVSLNFA